MPHGVRHHQFFESAAGTRARFPFGVGLLTQLKCDLRSRSVSSARSETFAEL